jgi:hypothetical protein
VKNEKSETLHDDATTVRQDADLPAQLLPHYARCLHRSQDDLYPSASPVEARDFHRNGDTESALECIVRRHDYPQAVPGLARDGLEARQGIAHWSLRCFHLPGKATRKERARDGDAKNERRRTDGSQRKEHQVS